jgi:hypothetical protein
MFAISSLRLVSDTNPTGSFYSSDLQQSRESLDEQWKKFQKNASIFLIASTYRA